MIERRWPALVAASAVCGALYLGFEVGGYAASDVGGRITLAARRMTGPASQQHRGG